MKMEKIIHEIENAIQKQCFLPALALTLVIPDICAKFDYRKIYDKKEKYKEHAGKGAAYAKWYDTNIAEYDINPKTGIVLIDGWSCWKLRCQFLHSGSIDINKPMSTDGKTVKFKLISSKDSNFEWTLGGISCVEYSENKKDQNIELDIANFCGKILAVIEHSYLNNEKFIEYTESMALNYIEFE